MLVRTHARNVRSLARSSLARCGVWSTAVLPTWWLILARRGSGKLPDAFGGEHAWDAGEVHGNRYVGPRSGIGVEERLHLRGGIVAELHDQDAAVTELNAGFGE